MAPGCWSLFRCFVRPGPGFVFTEAIYPAPSVQMSCSIRGGWARPKRHGHASSMSATPSCCLIAFPTMGIRSLPHSLSQQTAGIFGPGNAGDHCWSQRRCGRQVGDAQSRIMRCAHGAGRRGVDQRPHSVAARWGIEASAFPELSCSRKSRFRPGRNSIFLSENPWRCRLRWSCMSSASWGRC